MFGLDEVDTIVTDEGRPVATIDGAAGAVASRSSRRRMIDGVIPREIREGPAAIRATDRRRRDAREIATPLRPAASVGST